MQDFSQTTNADVTKLDMKDEGHSLYSLIDYFCHVRSTGLRGSVHYLGGISKSSGRTARVMNFLLFFILCNLE